MSTRRLKVQLDEYYRAEGIQPTRMIVAPDVFGELVPATFDGIPVEVDRRVPPGTAYVVNDLYLHQS